MVIKPQMTGKFSQARLAYSPGHFFLLHVLTGDRVIKDINTGYAFGVWVQI